LLPIFSGEARRGSRRSAGFVEEVTPEQAKTKAVEIAKQVIAKKENSELAIARGIMQKYGVSKVSEVPAGKEVELYNDFKAGFPQYVAG
jgi:copper(I)-binding protein